MSSSESSQTTRPRPPIPCLPPISSSPSRLLTGDKTAEAPSDDLLQSLAPAVFPTLLRGLSDTVEKVREKCATLISQLVAKLTIVEAPILRSLMPAVVKCVGTHPVEEPSEEIRLLLVELVHAAVKKSGAAMAPFMSELVAVLSVSLADQFHDVKKACCAAVESLVERGVPEEVGSCA